jgi:hypothetical protein
MNLRETLIALLIFLVAVGAVYLVSGHARGDTAAIVAPVSYGPDVQSVGARLVYFRDDNQRLCFVMLEGTPASLQVISCEGLRWP